jgi:hypothetical protein
LITEFGLRYLQVPAHQTSTADSTVLYYHYSYLFLGSMNALSFHAFSLEVNIKKTKISSKWFYQFTVGRIRSLIPSCIFCFIKWQKSALDAILLSQYAVPALLLLLD